MPTVLAPACNATSLKSYYFFKLYQNFFNPIKKSRSPRLARGMTCNLITSHTPVVIGGAQKIDPPGRNFIPQSSD